ncbi:MAG: hypothetical protein AAB546_01985 [Patescibacteria group bacterium]
MAETSEASAGQSKDDTRRVESKKVGLVESERKRGRDGVVAVDDIQQGAFASIHFPFTPFLDANTISGKIDLDFVQAH